MVKKMFKLFCKFRVKTMSLAQIFSQCYSISISFYSLNHKNIPDGKYCILEVDHQIHVNVVKQKCKKKMLQNFHLKIRQKIMNLAQFFSQLQSISILFYSLSINRYQAGSIIPSSK